VVDDLWYLSLRMLRRRRVEVFCLYLGCLGETLRCLL